MRTSVNSSTSVSVFWDPIPHPIDENGVITHYTVEYISVFSSDVAMVPANELRIELTGLEELTQYTIRVAAATSVGIGPFSLPAVITTFEDGNLIYCLLLLEIISGLCFLVMQFHHQHLKL